MSLSDADDLVGGMIKQSKQRTKVVKETKIDSNTQEIIMKRQKEEQGGLKETEKEELQEGNF